MRPAASERGGSAGITRCIPQAGGACCKGGGRTHAVLTHAAKRGGDSLDPTGWLCAQASMASNAFWSLRPPVWKSVRLRVSEGLGGSFPPLYPAGRGGDGGGRGSVKRAERARVSPPHTVPPGARTYTRAWQRKRSPAKDQSTMAPPSLKSSPLMPHSDDVAAAAPGAASTSAVTAAIIASAGCRLARPPPCRLQQGCA